MALRRLVFDSFSHLPAESCQWNLSRRHTGHVMMPEISNCADQMQIEVVRLFMAWSCERPIRLFPEQRHKQQPDMLCGGALRDIPPPAYDQPHAWLLIRQERRLWRSARQRCPMVRCLVMISQPFLLAHCRISLLLSCTAIALVSKNAWSGNPTGTGNGHAGSMSYICERICFFTHVVIAAMSFMPAIVPITCFRTSSSRTESS